MQCNNLIHLKNKKLYVKFNYKSMIMSCDNANFIIDLIIKIFNFLRRFTNSYKMHIKLHSHNWLRRRNFTFYFRQKCLLVPEASTAKK